MRKRAVLAFNGRFAVFGFCQNYRFNSYFCLVENTRFQNSQTRESLRTLAFIVSETL